MKIGVYSASVQAPLYAGQDAIREFRGDDDVPKSIRKLRETLMRDCPPSLSVVKGFAEKFPRDFSSTIGCRDLLMHVRECGMTLPQLEEAMDELNLHFVGFDSLPAHVTSAFREQHGNESICNMRKWHEFDESHPNTLTWYLFWCYHVP